MHTQFAQSWNTSGRQCRVHKADDGFRFAGNLACVRDRRLRFTGCARVRGRRSVRKWDIFRKRRAIKSNQRIENRDSRTKSWVAKGCNTSSILTWIMAPGRLCPPTWTTCFVYMEQQARTKNNKTSMGRTSLYYVGGTTEKHVLRVLTSNTMSRVAYWIRSSSAWAPILPFLWSNLITHNAPSVPRAHCTYLLLCRLISVVYHFSKFVSLPIALTEYQWVFFYLFTPHHTQATSTKMPCILALLVQPFLLRLTLCHSTTIGLCIPVIFRALALCHLTVRDSRLV
jgi:hypothetical protein